MALESATYISDLVSTNPTSGDAKAQGDDHLRLIKSTLKTTFPNVNGAVTATVAQLNGPVSGTSQASTSGTSIDFTSIPSWAKRITVLLSGVSTNAATTLLFQLGDSGGIEATGYLSMCSQSTTTSNQTTGFNLISAGAANVLSGAITFCLADAATNTWVAQGNIVNTNGAGESNVIAGSKATSAALDRVRVTTFGGTATFDAGLINILYD